MVEEPSEGTQEDTQDPGQHPAPSTQAQAQDLLQDAARQSEEGTNSASASKSMGPPEGFELEENEEERIKPARNLKEEKVNICIVNFGEDDSGDGTTSTSDGGYEFGVNPNEDSKLAQTLRESLEEQRARLQKEGGGEQDGAIGQGAGGGEERIKPARKLKEEKVNVCIVNFGEDDSCDGTTSTSNGGYKFGVNPNNNTELVMALRVSMEEQRASWPSALP